MESSAAFGPILNSQRRSSSGLVTSFAAASAMVGICFCLIVFQASTTHVSQEPVTTAATAGSSANALMLRSEAVLSDRLS